MRYVAAVAGVVVLTSSACVGPSSTDPTASQASAATSGDSADTSCQVVLRHTDIDFESSMGPQTDCSSGTCWVVVPIVFDVAMAQSLADVQAFVWYQGQTPDGGTAPWQQSAPAEPIAGCDELPDGPCAPIGFRRYQAVLRTGTFTPGDGSATVDFVPYIVLTATDARLFDHNRIADPLGSYSLTQGNNWTIGDDASACPGVAPTARLTATFAAGWQNSSTGTLQGGGKLDVDYDVYRMPQNLGCSTDGVDAFATLGSVQFQPSGQVLSEVVNGPLYPTSGQFTSLPLEFDVPAGTTSAALWFEASSDCAAATWDSDYGHNYVFTAP